jgi:hypothetical protein
MDAQPPIDAQDSDDNALTRLHPNHVKVLRIKASLASLPFLVAALIVEASGALPPAVVILPVTVLALAVIFRVPLRRHLARGYAMSADRLRVVRGILFRSDTVVPFGRVQHIDVNQDPIERFYGVATLTLHTAGTHNASVALPGLEHGHALEMREEIRQHIKREAV